jgi:ABC-type branched-subunit amino acid transport system ATPase component/ABC-type branched-subunit amino acid transport system permease subunit
MAETAMTGPSAPESSVPAASPGAALRLAHRPWLSPVLAGLVGLVVVLALSGDVNWVYTSALVIVYAVLTVGLNFAQGAAGMFTLATAAFMGLGAYATSTLTLAHGWTPVQAMLGGVVLCSAVAALFALLTLRVGEVYLAIATLALVQILAGLLQAFPSLTGGYNGIPTVPPFSVFGFVADQPMEVALTNLGFLVLLGVGAGLVLAARPGRAMRAAREDHLAARGAAVRVHHTYNLAFVLAAAYASVAGSLFAHTINFVDPTSFQLDTSIIAMAMLVTGGAGSVTGAILGAAVLQYAGAVLVDFRVLSSLLFGLVILFGTLVHPGGIVGGVKALVARSPGLTRVFGPKAGRPPPPAERPVLSAAPPGGHAAEPLVAVDVARSFGGLRALSGVSLTLHPYEIHALIGPNGSGKSTFINVLSGLYASEGGRVSIGKRRVDRWSIAARARAGIVRTYQNGRLFKGLPVEENVRIAADHRRGAPGPLGRRFPGVTGAAWTELVLGLTGLTDLAVVEAGRLGYGQQRRVELARALALDPQYLLLDEPAAGLSTVEKDELVGLLVALRDSGIAVLLVEHSMDVVMRVADVVTVLDFGRTIGHGTPDEVRADRAVVAAYLGVG